MDPPSGESLGLLLSALGDLLDLLWPQMSPAAPDGVALGFSERRGHHLTITGGLELLGGPGNSGVRPRPVLAKFWASGAARIPSRWRATKPRTSTSRTVGRPILAWSTAGNRRSWWRRGPERQRRNVQVPDEALRTLELPA